MALVNENYLKLQGSYLFCGNCSPCTEIQGGKSVCRSYQSRYRRCNATAAAGKY